MDQENPNDNWRARFRATLGVGPPVPEPAQIPLRRRVDRLTLDELADADFAEGSVVFAIAEIDRLVTADDLLASPFDPQPTVDLPEEEMWAIAEVIAANMRREDAVYVTDSNEFGLFIKDVTLAEAANVVARVSAAVNREFPVEESGLVSLSIGSSRALEAKELIGRAKADLAERRVG